MPSLLLRGMLVGLVAGLLAFGFARVFGEPSVDRSIAFEQASEEATPHDHAAGADHETELVSRRTQAGLGLLVGTGIYGVALGGLFAIAFALCFGRAGEAGPRKCAGWLALLGFIAIYAVPFLKYPADPPAVGEAATIGMRTGLYLSMIVLSTLAMLVAFSLRRLLTSRLGVWNATLVAAVVFVALAGVAGLVLPVVDEVPAAFPASTLWSFRLADVGIQATLWATIGLGFGMLTQRRLDGHRRGGHR